MLKLFKRKKDKKRSDLQPKGIKKSYIPANFNGVVWEYGASKIEEHYIEKNGKKLIIG